jgi:hypothetical protein
MYRRVYLKAFAVGLCAILTSAAPATAQTSAGTSDKTKISSVEKKNEAVTYGKKLMSDFDAKLKDLEGQIARDSSAAQADAQRQLKDLKAQRVETGKKLDELGRASAQSWDSVKHGFADAFRGLQQSYDKTAASVKK